MNGFIHLHRKFLEWGWYKDSITKDVFIHLLITANYERKEWRGIFIERGQIIIGRKSLAEELGFTERAVRTALNHLKTTNEIAIKTTNKFSIVTICKYDIYQSEFYGSDQQSDQQNAQQVTSNRPATDQQVTTTKEYNNIEIKKERIKNI